MAVYTPLPCGHTVVHGARDAVPECRHCMEGKITESELARFVAHEILDDPSRDPDSDYCILARQYIRQLETSQGKR